jgi:histidinol-phosphate aminotransferase
VTVSRRAFLGALGAGTATIPVPASAGRSSAATKDGFFSLTSGVSPSDSVLRLNNNENPYGASPKTIQAMHQALAKAQWYPNGECDALQARIATLHNVESDRVVLGCGAHALLRAVVDEFVGTGKKIVTAQPTFDAIGRTAHRAGAVVVGVALTRYFAHDADAMLGRTDDETHLVYICNPNNPTGTLTPRDDLERLLRRLPATTYVVIDEAYHHYVDALPAYASFIDRPVHDPRLMILRTFSKIFGLAGLRVGYAIADRNTARRLASRLLRDDVSIVAASAARAALDDLDHARLSASQTADDRQEFFNQATARMLQVIDSCTNFVMIDAKTSAAEIIEHFRSHGVLVAGPFTGFPTHIRVSLRQPAEMRAFWRVWDLLPRHQHI